MPFTYYYYTSYPCLFLAIIGGLHSFYKDTKEVLGDLFCVFKKLGERINNKNIKILCISFDKIKGISK